MSKRLGRFQHLKEARIVGNWPTLSRWIRDYGFPRPIKIGNTSLFDLDEVDAWLESRRSKAPTQAA